MRRVIDTSEIDNIGTKIVKVPPVKYQKLVVPLRMRSIYWQYFGFPSNNNKIVTKDIIVCTLCKTQMIYNRNTSNLRTHLRGRHKNVLSNIDVETTTDKTASPFPRPKKTIPKFKAKKELRVNSDGEVDFSNITLLDEPMTSRISGDKEIPTMVVSEEGNETDIPNISIIFPNNDELCDCSGNRIVSIESDDSAEISDLIANFVVSDLISTELIDGPGFHRLVSNLSHKNVMIPNEKKLTDEILPSMYKANREEIYNNIVSGNITNVSLSFEEFVCSDKVECFSIYAHFLKIGEPNMETKLLTTISCTGIETVKQWTHVLDKILNDWGINFSTVSAVVLASSSLTLKAALSVKDIIHLPCLQFLIQEICSQKIFKHQLVEDLIKSARETVKITLEEQISEDEMSEMDDELDPILRPFGLDRPDSWLSTFCMLQGVLMRKKNILENAECSNKCPLNSKDWNDICSLINVLKPLKAIVVTLLEERNSVISLLNPLIWKMSNTSFLTDDSDSRLICEIKEIIISNLSNAYCDQNVQNFIHLATFLDPRFKSMNLDDLKFVDNQVSDLLNQLVVAGGLIDTSNSQESMKGKKTGRGSSINALLGSFNVKKSVSSEEKIKNEVAFYKNTGGAFLEECPLEWWGHMRQKCPNLIRLAHKYLCVPAIIRLNSHTDISEYLLFGAGRSSLKLNCLDMILFLHANKK